jgi:hypothetical protein
MAASDNFRLVNSSENAIPKYIPGMAADIKGLREELDKKFEVGVQIDATTRDLIAQAPAGTMGKGELDKIAMETTQQLDEIAKKGDYEHYTRPLMALGRNVHGKLGAIANDAKQEATYYDEIDKYKGWTESQKNDMKTKALVGSKPLQFDEMGRKVGGFKSGENWGDLPDPDEATREVLSMLGPDKYGVTEDIGTLYKKYKEGTIYETIGVDKIRQAFDSAAKTPGTKLYQYLDKQSRLQTFANTNGVDDKTAYDFFQNKFTPTGVNEDEIASEQLLKDKVLRGEKSPTLALQQLTNKDVYNTLYGNIFNYAATKQVSSITKEIKTEASPYELEELKDVFKRKEEDRKAKAEEVKLEGNVYSTLGPTIEVDPDLNSYETADKGYQEATKTVKDLTARKTFLDKALTSTSLSPNMREQYSKELSTITGQVKDAEVRANKNLAAVRFALDAAAAAEGEGSWEQSRKDINLKVGNIVEQIPSITIRTANNEEADKWYKALGKTRKVAPGFQNVQTAGIKVTGAELKELIKKYPNASLKKESVGANIQVIIPGVGRVTVGSSSMLGNTTDAELKRLVDKDKRIIANAKTMFTPGQGSGSFAIYGVDKKEEPEIASQLTYAPAKINGKTVTKAISSANLKDLQYDLENDIVYGNYTTGTGDKAETSRIVFDVSGGNTKENILNTFANSKTPSAQQAAFDVRSGIPALVKSTLDVYKPLTTGLNGKPLMMAGVPIKLTKSPGKVGNTYQIVDYQGNVIENLVTTNRGMLYSWIYKRSTK